MNSRATWLLILLLALGGGCASEPQAAERSNTSPRKPTPTPPPRAGAPQASSANPAQSPAVPTRPKIPGDFNVEIRPNIELMGLAWFWTEAGPDLEANEGTLNYDGRTISWKEWYGFDWALYADPPTRSFHQSKNLLEAARLSKGIFLDYLSAFLLQVDDFPNAHLNNSIQSSFYERFSPQHNRDEARILAEKYLESMNAFHREIHFEDFLTTHSNLYDNILFQVESSRPGKRLVAAMESFYGAKHDEYVLVPSLTVPTSMGFGAHYVRAGRKLAFNVFGSRSLQHFQTNAPIDMGFGDPPRLLSLAAHEFGHAFVNPVLDQAPPELIRATEPLFPPIQEAMQKQGYTTWMACLYEHFVRAGEVMLARRMGDMNRAQTIYTTNIRDKRFAYLRIIVEEMAQTEPGAHDPKVYPMLVARVLRHLEKEVAAGDPASRLRK